MKENNILYRKAEKKIIDFLESKDEKALLVTGARQVGKTFLIENIAKKRFKHFVKIDFLLDRVAKTLFEDAKDASDILTRITALSNTTLIPGETLIFLDEVQECKESITLIKYLVQEGSYKYIISGSLLGVELYNVRSIPVGYMDSLEMFPLDFEEFAIANGVARTVLDSIHDAFVNKREVDGIIHDLLMRLFRLYLVVGGMPAAVSKYLETKNIAEVMKIQESIILRYREDISKYEQEDRKLRIRKVFDLIPAELNEKNKRFVLKDVDKNARTDRYENTFVWLSNAGAAIPVYNVKEPSLPLKLSQTATLFKLFLSDVGLLSSMYMDGIQLKILNNEKDINFGAVYENVAAQELRAHGYKNIYYFNSKRQGEVDFLIDYNGNAVPLEIKSGKDYTTHSALTNILDNPDYQISEAFVFSNSNVKTKDKIVYLPMYMLMFIEKTTVPEKLIYKLDLSALR